MQVVHTKAIASLTLFCDFFFAFLAIRAGLSKEPKGAIAQGYHMIGGTTWLTICGLIILINLSQDMVGLVLSFPTCWMAGNLVFTCFSYLSNAIWFQCYTPCHTKFLYKTTIQKYALQLLIINTLLGHMSGGNKHSFAQELNNLNAALLAMLSSAYLRAPASLGY